MPEINKDVTGKSPTKNGAAIIRFRQASFNDRLFLLKLRKVSMTEHLSTAGIELDDSAHMLRIDEYFADSQIICYQERAIGLIKLGQFPNKIHIRQFQLLPQYHGLGIGSRVLELLKRKAQERQLAISLNVFLKNPAKALYLRHGFIITGENELEYAMQWSG